MYSMEVEPQEYKLWGEDIYTKLSWFNIQSVKSAKVMVIGAGALGNEVVKNLALFGVSEVYIVDFDIVEKSNLTRSVFFREQDALLQKPKVEVLAERVMELNSEMKIHPILGDIRYDIGLGLIKEMNVVISCLDNRLSRYFLNRLCLRAGVPWVDGGIDGLEGTVRVFKHGENCYACNLGEHSLRDISLRISCASVVQRNFENDRVATTPVIASIIGAVEVQEALKLIHKKELEEGKFTSLCGKMFYWEGEHLTSKILSFKAYDDDCPMHELWDDIIPSDLTIDDTVCDVIQRLKLLTKSESAEITLLNFKFVDYIIQKSNENVKVYLKCPSYKVVDFVERDEVLKSIAYSDMYQKEYCCIDSNFPYKELSLRDLGVPNLDVLCVTTSKGEFHIALADCGEF